MKSVFRAFDNFRSSSSRAKNGAITVTLSNIVGQGSFILVTPILTTLYSPAEFGLFGTFVALYIIASHFCTLKYENAIAISSTDEHAAASVWLSLVLVVVLNIILYAFLFVCAKYDVLLSANSTVMSSYNEIVAGALLAGIGLTLNVWLLRQRRYTMISIIRILYSFAIIIAQILMGWLWEFPEGLIKGQIFGLVVMVVFQATSVIRADRTKLSAPSFKNLKYVASRFSNFPKFSVWATLIGQLSAQAPVIIFAATGNLQAAGFYFMALRLLQSPLGMISQSISQVVLAEAPDMHVNGKLDKLVGRIFSVCMRIGLLPLAVMCFLIVDIFSVLGMSEWNQTIVFIWIIVPWVFLVFILSPISVITTVLEKQKEWLIFQILMFLFRMAGLIIGVQYFDITTSVVIYTIVGFIFWLMFCFWILSELKIDAFALLREFIITSLVTLLCITVLYLMKLGLNYLALSTLRSTIILSATASIFTIFYLYRSVLFFKVRNVAV